MNLIGVAALVSVATIFISAAASIVVVYIAVRDTNAADRLQVLRGAAEVIRAALGKK